MIISSFVLQLDKIDTKIIIDFINKNNTRYFPKIPVHFFIVHTLPAITSVSIYDLKKQLTSVKEENKKRDKEIQNLKKQTELYYLK